MMGLRSQLLLLLFLGFVVGPVQAAYVYEYTGLGYNSVVNATYEPSGNPSPPPGEYEIDTMNISGQFTSNTLLSDLELSGLSDISGYITSYSFNDGRNTISDSNDTETPTFSVEVNASGQITSWDIFLGKYTPPTAAGTESWYIQTSFDGLTAFDQGRTSWDSTIDPFIRTDLGTYTGFTTGTWTSPVPLPATAWLLLTAIGGLFGVNNWNKRKLAA